MQSCSRGCISDDCTYDDSHKGGGLQNGGISGGNDKVIKEVGGVEAWEWIRLYRKVEDGKIQNLAETGDSDKSHQMNQISILISQEKSVSSLLNVSAAIEWKTEEIKRKQQREKK